MGDEENKDPEEDVKQKESEAMRTPTGGSMPVPQLMEYPVTFWRKIWKKIKSSVE